MIDIIQIGFSVIVISSKKEWFMVNSNLYVHISSRGRRQELVQPAIKNRFIDAFGCIGNHHVPPTLIFKVSAFCRRNVSISCT